MPDIKLGRHRGVFAAVWYNEAGDRQRRSLGTSDRALANTRLVALRTQLNAQAPAGPLTIAAIFERYIENREANDKSVARIKDAWKRLGPHFGHMRPVDVTEDEASDYIAVRGKAVRPGTIHTELVYLRAALAFAVKKDWITRAPYIKTPQKPSPREHHLALDEVMRLHDAALMPHMKLFIRLAVGTAGRASALLQLTWDRVDLSKRTIDLRDPERNATRKGRARVPINDGLHAALVEAQKVAQSKYVIEYNGGKVISVKKGIAAAARRAGVECSPHVLRHTAAVLMVEGGTPLEQVGQYLGHTDFATTYRVYARFTPGFLQKAARTLDW
jgi:integrase